MSLFTISAEDIARDKIVPADWYGCRIVAYKEEANKNKDGQNHVFDLKVEDGEHTGKIFRHWVSDKAPAMAKNFIEAVQKQELNPEGVAIDFNQFIGKKLKVRAGLETFEGKDRNALNDFAPEEADTEVPFGEESSAESPAE